MPNRLVLVVALLVSGSSLMAADWPTYLNGNRRHGYTSEKIELPSLELSSWMAEGFLTLSSLELLESEAEMDSSKATLY